MTKRISSLLLVIALILVSVVVLALPDSGGHYVGCSATGPYFIYLPLIDGDGTALPEPIFDPNETPDVTHSLALHMSRFSYVLEQQDTTQQCEIVSTKLWDTLWEGDYVKLLFNDGKVNYLQINLAGDAYCGDGIVAFVADPTEEELGYTPPAKQYGGGIICLGGEWKNTGIFDTGRAALDTPIRLSGW